MKKNHTSQMLLMDAEIAKLKEMNHLKTNEFESQLLYNRNLK